MPVCFDTSLLVKLYTPEPNTQAVITLVASLKEPIWVTSFHHVEFVNALMCKRGRGSISAADADTALRNLLADQEGGVLWGRKVDWEQAFYASVDLSLRYAATTSCRTLDVLHVALALQLKASALATTDKRQIAIANAVGLKVLTP